jgi:peptidoglycan/LPS O-acetylase OafA/YrhL
MTSSVPRRVTFPLIDALRGFAAIGVVIYHVVELFKWPGFPTGGPASWLHYGWMGVDLFFVISGFVIGLSAFSGIDDLGTRNFRQPFILRRLVRIVPLYYLSAFLFVIFIVPQLFFEPGAWKQWVTHALFIQNLFPAYQGSIDGTNWSVATEMQFYVLMLALGPWLRNAHPVKIGAGALMICWLWRWISFDYLVEGLKPHAFSLFFYQTQLPGMLDEFALGLLSARLIRSETGRAIVFGTRRSRWLLTASAAVTLASAIAMWAAHPNYGDNLAYYLLFRSVLGAACAGVILVACSIENRTILLLSRPIRYFGKISYGIYLWHLLVIVSLMQFTWLTGDRALPVVLWVTVSLAAISWHFFERPILLRYGSHPSALWATPAPNPIRNGAHNFIR